MKPRTIAVVLAALAALAGCANNGPQGSGGRYQAPATGGTARLEVNNLGPFAISVGVFDNENNCTCRREIHYNSDRDDLQKNAIAGYENGKPIHYRHVSVEHAGLGVNKTLRNIELAAKPTLMNIATSTPGEFSYPEPKVTNIKYKRCSLTFKFSPAAGSEYSVDVRSDVTGDTCSVLVYEKLRDAAGTASRKTIPAEKRAC